MIKTLVRVGRRNHDGRRRNRRNRSNANLPNSNLIGAKTTLSPFTALLVEKLADHRLDQLLDGASGRFARLR